MIKFKTMKKITIIVTVSDAIYQSEFKEDMDGLAEEFAQEMKEEFPGEPAEMCVTIEDI
jgi:hypothetical protein